MAVSNPTPKQQRNGADTGAAGSGATMAQPGPDVTQQVASGMRQAQAAEARFGREAEAFLSSPQGAGTGGHEVGGSGAMYEWDAGLAIRDVEGGGSG